MVLLIGPSVVSGFTNFRNDIFHAKVFVMSFQMHYNFFYNVENMSAGSSQLTPWIVAAILKKRTSNSKMTQLWVPSFHYLRFWPQARQCIPNTKKVVLLYTALAWGACFVKCWKVFVNIIFILMPCLSHKWRVQICSLGKGADN